MEFRYKYKKLYSVCEDFIFTSLWQHILLYPYKFICI